jgi:hypothetical protein
MAQHTSRLWTINLLDLGKGALVAAITAGLTVIQQALSTGGLSGVDWKLVGSVALAGGVAYIVKNWLTPAQVIIPVEEKNQVSVPVITVNDQVIVPPSTPAKGQDEPEGTKK